MRFLQVFASRHIASATMTTLLLGACGGPSLLAGVAASVGTTSSGWLRGGTELPDHGLGFVRARPGESTRWGTPTLIDLLKKSAASVSLAIPGGRPLRIGDLSAPLGGKHERHHSHRTGRDADVLFFLADGFGRSVTSSGFVRFGADGLGRGPHSGSSEAELRFFDDARNWEFVRALLMSEEAGVQWIFCAKGVKTRLLRYAARHEPSAEALFRAAYVLHQPTDGRPHDDHFHIRVACTAEQRASGCEDKGPLWPWLRPRIEKPAREDRRADNDELLVSALLFD